MKKTRKSQLDKFVYAYQELLKDHFLATRTMQKYSNKEVESAVYIGQLAGLNTATQLLWHLRDSKSFSLP